MNVKEMEKKKKTKQGDVGIASCITTIATKQCHIHWKNKNVSHNCLGHFLNYVNYGLWERSYLFISSVYFFNCLH